MPGEPELVVVVAVAVVAVGAGTCLGLSDAVGGGAHSHVLRTFALRGGACRTGRSLSSAGIARTSYNYSHGSRDGFTLDVKKSHSPLLF